MTRDLQEGRLGGFTLLELLVVLTLLAMLSALVAQSLGGLAAVDESFSRVATNMQNDFLAEHRIRLMVSGLVPDPKLSAGFAGTPAGFSGLTLAAPVARQGLPLPINVRLESDDEAPAFIRLTGGQPRQRLDERWSLGPGRWEWRYLDHDGEWHEAWPAAPPLLIVQAQLPKALVLVDTDSEAPRWWFSVLAHPVPRQEFWPEFL